MYNVFQAYWVFRGDGKGSSSDESRNPTAKFITKNRGAQGNKQPSLSAQNSTGTGLQASLVSTTVILQQESSGIRVPEDVQVKLISHSLPYKFNCNQ